MKIPLKFAAKSENYRRLQKLIRLFIIAATLIFTWFVITVFAQGQKASAIVIHDATGASGGGENATSNLRNEFKSVLEREKPCVETMDDQDIRDAVQDERERALLEGADSNEALQALGQKMGAGMVMVVKATPLNGSSVYSASVMDSKTGNVVAREMGTGGESIKQMAENLVRSLGPYLADNCKPHWAGTINYVYSLNETKQKTDAGAMRAAVRNTKRTLTETSNMTATIKATLSSPLSKSSDSSVNSPNARVTHRTQFIMTKNSSTGGELYCRLPGRNPFWKGFSEDYTETTTLLGQGTDTMPVFISVDDDGSYTISVNAPGGVLYAKIETNRSATSCGSDVPNKETDAQSLPEGKMQGTSFEAKGKTNSPKPTTLSGQQNLPDGKTKITWNLRLVKAKG